MFREYQRIRESGAPRVWPLERPMYMPRKDYQLNYEDMRRETTNRTLVKEHPRVEDMLDMLGRVYLYISERANRGLSHRSHRRPLRMYIIRGFRAVAEAISRLLRNAGAVIGKGNGWFKKVAKRLRKHGVNGN
tara:strand:- start:250 stop:648 length:399 start_codon:yes stop_codon:yes gene_type:complete